MLDVMLAALLIAVSTTLPVPCFQDKTPLPNKPSRAPVQAPGPRAHKWMAIDGKEATPGRIPEGTSKGALKLWNEVLAASRIQKAEGSTPPVHSFDLTFDAEIRTKPGTASVIETVRFRFLDKGKGFLSAAFLTKDRKVKRQTIRGSKGDHLHDGKEWTSLQGREDQESRRELDRWVAIARNFVALTQPAAVRIMGLKELSPLAAPADGAAPTEELRIEFGEGRFISAPNARAMQAAKTLRWLEVTSPDFQLFDSGSRPANAEPLAYRALLGLDSGGRIRLAQFHEDNGGAVRVQGALFVEVSKWKELSNGYVLPGKIDTYRSDATRGHGSFEVQPALDLWLLKSSARINPARPPLQARDFEPSN